MNTVLEDWELSFNINGDTIFKLYSDDNVLFTHDKECVLALRSALNAAQSFISDIPDEPIK